jgi:hypothetical protein
MSWAGGLGGDLDSRMGVESGSCYSGIVMGSGIGNVGLERKIELDSSLRWRQDLLKLCIVMEGWKGECVGLTPEVASVFGFYHSERSWALPQLCPESASALTDSGKGAARGREVER